MSILNSLDISSSGLHAERARMNAISSNIANAQVTRTPEGGPYRRKEVVFKSIPLEENEFNSALKTKLNESLQKVEVDDVVSDLSAPKMVHEPDHPDADPEGNVAYPNVNTVEELTNMIEAQRSYEANLASLNAAKRMAQKAIDLGNN